MIKTLFCLDNFLSYIKWAITRTILLKGKHNPKVNELYLFLIIKIVCLYYSSKLL